MRRVALISVVGLAVLLAAGLWYQLRAGVTQPIAFSHALHVTELGSECTDCHLYARTGVRATIPNIEVCGDCHEEAQTESAEEARVVEFVRSGEPIPWLQVTWVPDHVYFSHRRHTTLAELECERCHGAMAERALPVTRPAVDLDMDHCMACHAESGVSNDCLLCHM